MKQIKILNRKFIKRFFSMMLAFLMVVGVMPLESFVSYAAEPTINDVDNITIIRTYRGQNLYELSIGIEAKDGKNIKDIPVYFGATQVTNSTEKAEINDSGYVAYILTTNQYNYVRIGGGGAISIGESDLPTLGSPNAILVKAGEQIIIPGTGLEKVKDGSVTGHFEGSVKLPISVSEISSDDLRIEKTIPADPVLGEYDVTFSQKVGNITRQHRYEKVFNVYGELSIDGNNVTMSPNRGPKGTTITLEAPPGELLPENKMNVFFLKALDGTDPYTKNNMGTNEIYTPSYTDPNTGKVTDRFIVTVPNLDTGRYYVVITNDVTEGEDPTGKVHSRRTFPLNIFNVAEGGISASIVDMQPNTGPETGIDATIDTQNIGTLSREDFVPANDNGNIVGNVTLPGNGLELEVEYKGDDEDKSIGQYLLLGNPTSGIDVKKIVRKITVSIGGNLSTFREGYSLDSTSDKFEITVPGITLTNGEDPNKSVTIRIETIITPVTGDPLTIVEETIWKNKFTYTPIRFNPEITTIIPDKIPVDSQNRITDDLQISIIGKNFFKYRYKNAMGETKIKYPVIDLGGQIIFNKNIPSDTLDMIPSNMIIGDDVKLEVYNNGIPIEGNPNSELGNRIVVTIPKGTQINPDILGQTSQLRLSNPIKNTVDIIDRATSNSNTTLPIFGNITFVKVGTDKTPRIIGDLDPNIITTDGEKGVVIRGEYFGTNVAVYLDGEKINGIKRNGTGTEIIFDAPPKPEGRYQIIVQNEEGGIATYDEFYYVKTYTDPKINDFSPKKGTINTLVTLKGENIVRPNPLVTDLSGMGIWRLIGTRVFLDGIDVNDYYGSQTNPELRSYTSPVNNPIINNINGELILSDYYYSIILQEGISEPKYYSIYLDSITGQLVLTDGDQDVYVITTRGSGFVATKGGQEHTLNVTNSSLIINQGQPEEIALTFKTPYAVKDGIIVGNRVNIISNKELVFEVADKYLNSQPGYKDIKIVNPDTKSDSKIGNNGFYYTNPSGDKPTISGIRPNEGSVAGGYFVTITGNGFVNLGANGKTSVVIGSVTVDSKDIEVAADGKSIRFKVPKYPGDLTEETKLDKKSVIVTVINPNNTTSSLRNGFTYVIPTSNPNITGIFLDKGSAAGGEVIRIEGDDFRFYEKYDEIDNFGEWDEGEPYTDSNGNNRWDDLRYWLNDAARERYEEFLSEEDGWEKRIVPILPKVYFNGVQVEIKHFAGGQSGHFIEIETPKGTKGPVEIYLVNNDYGISNKRIFTYESSSPKISDISPPTGRRQGNESVFISGSGFYESKVNVIKSKTTLEEELLQIVQFGDTRNINVSNEYISIDTKQNSGVLENRRAKVSIGNLTVEYDATSDNKILDFTLEEGTGENKVVYELKGIPYNDGEVFLPINLLKCKDEKTYSGYEYVRIAMERIPGANITTRLRVDRGFSPQAELVNQGATTVVSLRTPSYYTIGNVPVTVINPDGGKADTVYQYKNPDSRPQITNITRDGQQPQLGDNGATKILTVNMKGGSIITIEGSDFRDVESIQIGNVLKIDPKDILVNEPNRLVFKMPAVNESALLLLHRVVVINEDGGTASSDVTRPTPIYIQFIKGESSPQIESITPPRGPATGGNTVIIKGKDFRETMEGYTGSKLKVYFDGKPVPDKDIRVIDYRTISVVVPPGAAGSVEVKVENPDGEMSNTVEYTYSSNPRITAVVDPLDPTERAAISVISILGEQVIKLKGSSFMEGAKVYFNPKIKPAEEGTGDNANLIYIEGLPYILESGTEGTEYKWMDGETVTIKTPPGKPEDFGVIVVNPDGGASPIYTNLIYGLPEIAAPTGVVAELVYDRFIRVHWNGVTGAKEYEIFVVIDDQTMELIGSTELTSFAYNDLEPKTRYKFIVKAVGDFGSSKPSMESNTVRTGSTVGPPDEDGALGEDTTMSKSGNTANVVIGTKYSGRGDIVIDLTTGVLAGSREVVISLPASVVVNDGNRNIQVLGSDFAVQFQPSAFNVATVRENSKRSDAGVRFVIKTDTGNTQVQSGNQLSNVYSLDASVYVGNTSTSIDYFAKSINLVLDYDLDKASLRKLTKVEFNYFNPTSNSWQSVGASTSMIEGVASGEVSRLGRYTIIGSRR